MRYGSVCSGIEAATQAWEPLGWTPQWFSEIEPFPCKVLAHHYPHVPNLGDMTKLKSKEKYHESIIDLLVGGTPCQAFSIAGLRGGLGDERSNLALEFCRILIDRKPKWFVWENVPGVFSSFTDEENSGDGTGDCLQRGLGDVYTETSDFGSLLAAFRESGYSVCWRVLDAQYFGVPQRRRRVFVVGHLGDDWRPPAAVLFERDSLRRDFTPRRKKGENTSGTIEKNPGVRGYRMTGFGKYADDNTSGTIKKRDHKDATDLVIQPFVFDTTQITSPQNGSNPQPGDPSHPFVKTGHPPTLVHVFKESGGCEGGGKGYMGQDNVTYSLTRVDPQRIATNTVVRRLTPLEFERLQGFPDNYTKIDGATDTSRYEAIGNSMAVPVMRWIGERIDLVNNVMSKLKK